MNELFIWILVIVVHELGHLAAFRIFKIKAYVELKWWGFQLDDFSNLNSTLLQRIPIAFAGILSGLLVVLLFINDTFNLTLYLLACIVDLYVILVMIFFKPKFWNEKIKYLLWREDVLAFPRLTKVFKK